MCFFLFFSVCALLRAFRINRTTHSQFVSSEMMHDQDQCFRLDVSIGDPEDGLSKVDAEFTFMSGQRLITEKRRTYRFYGIAFPNQSFFALAGMLAVDTSVERDWVVSFLAKTMFDGSRYRQGLVTQRDVSDFVMEYPETQNAFRIVTLAFQVEKRGHGEGRFDIPNLTVGTSFEGKTIEMELRGFEIDARRYSRELRISTAVLGFMLTVSLHAWASMLRHVYSQRSINYISSTTLLMELLYEVSFGVVMTSVSDSNAATSRLVVYFFFAQLFVYGLVQFSAMLIVLLRRSVANVTCVGFTVKGVLCIVCVMAPFMRVLQNNNFCSFIAALVWVPQISKNVHLVQKNGISLQYVLCSSMNRIIFRMYMTRYEMSIFEADHLVSDDLICFVLVVQCVIIALQKLRGPHFFLPNLLKPRLFNYQETIPDPSEVCPICYSAIDDPDDSAVTPCHHSFHMSCLRRCMAEKDECPLCREPLPPIT